MDKEDLVGVLEALLFATDQPLSIPEIGEILGPENQAELENALERVAVLSPDAVIRPEAFGSELRSSEASDRWPSIGGGGDRPMTLKAALDEAERRAVEIALDSTGGSRVEAARILGVSLRTLYYKLKHLAA